MKLFYATASPFVRKVMVLAIETGIVDDIELVRVAVLPTNPNPDVCAGNPVGKIPTLVRDDGGALYDSRVICEYLDSLHGGTPMFPEGGEARWTAVRRQALADGIMDAAVGARYETFLRPEALRWKDWVDGQMGKARRGLDVLDGERLGGTLDIGTIAIACALGYMDFRYPDEGWRDSRPGLAAWFEEMSARPSMTRTVPE
jgi:glutathione S-transferase